MKATRTPTLALLLAATLTAQAHGISGVGMTNQFPAPVQTGAPIEFQLWQWGKEPGARKELMKLHNGLRIPLESVRGLSLMFRFRIAAVHDTMTCRTRSSDSFDRIAWGPEKVKNPSPETLYRDSAEWLPHPPQVGKYCIEVEAANEGRSVGRSVVLFEIVDETPPPRNTHYLAGRKDSHGNEITSSKPVELTRLNETSKLKDNDYPFEPQHAFNVINFERFPPFQLPSRFLAVWNSRRFSEENKMGGPLDRGFTSMATVKSSRDNLPISQRAWFHTPDLQVMFIEKWYKEHPEQYVDLKAYADHRSAFVSATNAFKLGWKCYESWGAGGYGPYDPGLYGWDEEQMWPTIGAKLLKEHPDLVPETLRGLRDGDPDVKDPNTLARIHSAYIEAWGEFVGQGYRGARACAAARGRTFKIWHYGSKAPGECLFLGPDDARVNSKTGIYRYEEMDQLWPWFKKGNEINFEATEYARQIDYFHKDFYYHTLFPEHSSMYEKDAQGNYRLDIKGRRNIRKDVFEETVYAEPVNIGHEDCETGPAFLKAFLAKGENALYWLNGGAYYKRHGTLITEKQLIPALRPGNQETWGECAKLGSRPVNPYLAEAAAIYIFMMGLEGLYYWDARGFTGPAGYGPDGKPETKDTLGEIEFVIKGLQRVAQFNSLFEGEHSYVRPARHYDTWNRDHPLIRGLINGRNLLLAMTNPYLDPGETQDVEIWYGSDYAGRERVWHDKVTLPSRRTGLFQCRLPALRKGESYDPDRLRFRYTCVDGNFRQTFSVTGNYDVQYPDEK